MGTFRVGGSNCLWSIHLLPAMWNRSVIAFTHLYGTPKWRAVALASMVLFAFAFVVTKREDSFPSADLINTKRASYQSSVQFNPSLELLNGTDVIWQIPDSPKAALFVAHGCGIRAANFWDNYPGCPNCIGLPEERIFVLRALERKYAVLTISSLHRCWSFDEIKNVKWIIKWWIDTNKLGTIPLVAMGASSGGYFVSALAAEMRFHSIAIMISEGTFASMGVPKDYPPTLFVHMPKDQVTMSRIQKNMRVLRQNGVPVSEIRCMEFPLSPDLLLDRIPRLNKTFCLKLYDVFREKGFIDQNGYLKNDGRQFQWKEALVEKDMISENYELLKHIDEELNLAFALHELTSFQADEILFWFESHMNPSMGP